MTILTILEAVHTIEANQMDILVHSLQDEELADFNEETFIWHEIFNRNKEEIASYSNKVEALTVETILPISNTFKMLLKQKKKRMHWIFYPVHSLFRY